MKLYLTIWMVLFLVFAGCATLTDEEREEQDYEFQEYVVKYRLYEAECNRLGGSVFIQRGSVTRVRYLRAGVPGPFDRYACVQ